MALPVGHERIGLVDEEHPTQSAPEGGLCLRRRVADILTDQHPAVDLDQMSLRQHPQLGQYFSVQTGHGRLSGAGVAGEYEVAGQWWRS
jgi:hypothetical protein